MYYDGTKLMSLKDKEGNTPEIYICTSNRSAGKTTFFSRYLVNRFIKFGEKFVLLYRFKYELTDCSSKFFKDIQELFFPEYEMTSEKMLDGVYYNLFLNKKSCGYALALNCADSIKKISHFFSDTQRIYMDEFQSETNTYCDREVSKFRSIHTSIARGHGKQVRYVPVYMVSNPVSLLNPYYVAFGISNKLTNKTKFLRGDGFVLEQGFNESASKAQKESTFNRAFANDEVYAAYEQQGVYLNDALAFIEKPEGRSEYVATIRYEGKDFGIKRYPHSGIIYCDDKPDYTFPMRLSLSTADHNINYVMLQANRAFIFNMRYLFNHGAFRFKNLVCKDAIMHLVSY